MFRRLAFTAALLALVPACDKAVKENEMSAEEVATQLASVKVEPGQWQSTTTILSATGPLSKSDLDKMRGQKTKVSNCITPEQAARPSANFLAAQQNSDCTYQDFRLQGGKLTGRMTCTGGEIPGKMTTVMSGNYGSTGYDMLMDMESAALPGGTLKIRARTTGKRVGECSEAGE